MLFKIYLFLCYCILFQLGNSLTWKLTCIFCYKYPIELFYSSRKMNWSFGSAQWHTCSLFVTFSYVISSGIKKSPLVVLAIKSPVRLHRWTFHEERALVEFVGLASMDAKYGLSMTKCVWPAFRPGHTFWADAAKHILASTSSSVVLSSGWNNFICNIHSCSGKLSVSSWLWFNQKSFKLPVIFLISSQHYYFEL